MRAKIPPRVVNTLTLFAKVKMYAELARNRKKYRIKSRYGNNLYAATLHKGERVMTAKENRESSNGGGNSFAIAKFADQIFIREESDIEKVAYQLAKYIEGEALQVG